MENLIKIGEITKPQGIRGEVKIKAYVDDENRFYDLDEVYVGDTLYRVLFVRVNGAEVFLTLKGVADRNSAELLRGKELFVTRDNAVELNENEFFIVDVLGARVVLSDGTNIGEIIDITQSRTDIFTVRKDNGKILRFPFLKDLLIKMDLENKQVLLDAKRFSEVCCYED
ncbi:MAG: 16S rRNA processing protein RimM [Clostridia bacterium]|nr:16S rRNA processing protein RimM [Clostridia bacterium]